MKISGYTLILASIFASAAAYGDPLNESFNVLATALCDKTISERANVKEYKSLKLKGSKAEGVCLLTAKTALGNCMDDTAKIYKASLSSNKDRISKLTKSSLQFCADYSGVIAEDIVKLVADRAVSEKISVDEASNKVLSEAAKQ